MQSFFINKLFLSDLHFLKVQRGSPLIKPEEGLFSELLLLLENIRKEIGDINRDEHIIRALVYLVLAKLEKEENLSETSDGVHEIQSNRHLQGFIKLVEKHHLEVHEVQFYAVKLFISANYLNKIVRDILGTNSKKYIDHKIAQEAKNLLSFTDLSIAEISDQLNFETPSYFTRFFKKSEGLKPKEYRIENRSSKNT